MRAIKTIFASLAVSLAALPALAQDAGLISRHHAWGHYEAQSGGSKLCYVLSVPTDMQPTTLDHGQIIFSVSQRPGTSPSYEPQFIAAYNFQENSKVRVSVGDRQFSMFTRGNLAWLENPAEEPQLVTAMRSGSEMRVQAVSGRGNNTSYTFSLRGVTAALESINACN